MKRTLLQRALTRLVGRGSAYDMIPAYDYVQNLVEWHLNSYIGKSDRRDVLQFYIVGGYLGDEVPFLLKRYPRAKVRVFEASSRYQNKLRDRFADQDRVSIENAAVSDEVGKAVFHETNLRGSGSLLEVGPLASESYGTCAAEKFEVDTVTLDSVSGSDVIDCLWIDVQGAELRVLQGAENSLIRTKSIFTEVSIQPNLYQGAVTLTELEAFLAPRGFRIVSLGLDRANLTGNALFVHRECLKHAAVD